MSESERIPTSTRRQLERRAIQLQAAAEVSRAVSSILDPDELIQQVVDLIRERFDLYYAGLFLVDTDPAGESGEWAVLRAGTGEAGRQMMEQGHKLEIGGTSMIGWCVANQQARIALDVGVEAVRFDNPLLPETRSELALPLISRGQVLGAMTVQSAQEAAFTAADIATLQTMADQVAIAIENARLFDEAQRRAATLSSLYQIGREVSATLELDATLNMIVESTAHLVQADKSIILLVNVEEKRLIKAVGHGYSPELAEWFTYQEFADGISGWVLREGRPTISEDVRTDPRNTGLALEKAREEDGPRSIAVAPLLVKGRAIGTLTAVNKADQPAFTKDALTLITMFADQAAIAVDNARLFQERDQRITELAILNEMSQVLSAVLEMDDLLATVHQHVSHLFDTTNFYIAVYEEGSEEWTSIFELEHGQPQPRTRYKVGAGVTGYIIRTRQPVLLRNQQEGIAFEEERGIETLGPQSRSWMGVPLIAADRVVGVMAIQSYEQEHLYDDQDLALFSTIAAQVAVAIENLRLLEETRRRARQQEVVNEIGQAVSSALELDELLETVHQQVNRLFDTTNFYIALYRQDTDEWAAPLHLERGQRQPLAWRKVEAGLTGHIIRSHQPILLRSVEENTAFKESQGVEPVGEQAKSWMGVPLIAADQVVGVMAIQSYEQERLYGEQDLALFSTIADQVATAFENLRLLEEARRRAQELEVINEVGRATASVLELDAVLHQIVDITKSRFGHYFVDIALVEGEQIVFRGGSTIGDSDVRFEPDHMALDLHGPGLVSEAARTGQPVLVNDVRNDPRYVFIPELADTCSELAVPIEVKGRVIGTLDVQSDRPFAYDQADVALLQSLASQVGMAIQNARLFEAERRRTTQMQALRETAQVITSTLRQEDVFTRILEQLQAVVDYDSVALWLREGPRLRVAAGRGFPNLDELLTFAVNIADNPLFAELEETRQPLIIDDTLQDERFLALGGTTYVRSWLGVPLVMQDEMIGSITIDRHEPRGYTPKDGQLAMAFAGQAAVAVENARLFNDELQARTLLGQRIQELDCLNDIGRRIDENPPVPEFLQWVAERIPPAMRYPDVCLAAIEFNGQVYGPPEAMNQPCQIVQGLRVGGERVGPVYISYTEEHDFIDEESALLGDIVRRVSGYVENARLIQETQERVQAMSALYRAVQSVSVEFDLDTLTERLVDEACHLVEADYGVLATLDPDTGSVLYFKTAGIEKGRCPLTELPQGKGLLKLLLEGQTVRVDDLREHPSFSGDLPAGHLPIVSFLGLPLVYQNQVRGLLGVSNRATGRTFDQADEDLLGTFVAQATVTLENARLFQETQSALAQTGALYEASRAITAARSPEEIVAALVEHIDHTNLDRIIVALVVGTSEGHPLVEVQGVWDRAGQERPGRRFSSAMIPMLSEVGPQDIILVNDLATDPEIDETSRATFQYLGVQSVAVLPISTGQQPLGWLLLATTTAPREFTAERVRPFVVLAGQAAVALESQRLLIEAERRARREQIIREITAKMRASTDLDTILNTAVRELNTALGTSRTFVHLGTGPEPRGE